MTGTWFGLLLMGLLIWLWMEALAVRERAIRLGRQLCRDAGLQLLDHSVALERLRIRRRAGRIACERRYRFEVSVNGADRHRGHLDLAGNRLLGCSLPHRDAVGGSDSLRPHAGPALAAAPRDSST
jgi:hypothetical protein